MHCFISFFIKIKQCNGIHESTTMAELTAGPDKALGGYLTSRSNY